MTVAEFLTWNPDDPSAHAWQLIDGEPVAMAPASVDHGALHASLGGHLWRHATMPGQQCRAAIRPGIVPRLHSEHNFRVPAIGVTCAPSVGGQMLPDPLILIEILSPTNQTETWANVWTYLTLPTVREVLVVSGMRIEAKLLRRNANGAWPEIPIRIGPGDTLTLDSIGFTVPLTALYRTTTLATQEGTSP